MAEEYIWFKNSQNSRSLHKRNKKVRKSKLDALEKAGWVRIKGEHDRTPVVKPKVKNGKKKAVKRKKK